MLAVCSVENVPDRFKRAAAESAVLWWGLMGWDGAIRGRAKQWREDHSKCHCALPLSFFLPFCMRLPLSLSLFLSPPLSHSPSPSLFLSLTLSLSFFLCLSITLSPPLSLHPIYLISSPSSHPFPSC